MTPEQILDCALTRWSAGIGDPNLAGWITVAAYLVAGGLSLRLAARSGLEAVERAFWGVAGASLLFLAVNKQLDLQSLMTDAGRCVARRQGWYGARREVQSRFIVALVVAVLAAGAIVLGLLRRTLGRTGVALVGLVWITGFVLVRAAGFHHVDRLIGLRAAGLRLNWVFELGGIAIFILGAALAEAWRRRARKP